MSSNGRPVVGVTTYVENAGWPGWTRQAALLPQVYVDSVARAGGVPVLLPPHPVDGDGDGGDRDRDDSGAGGDRGGEGGSPATVAATATAARASAAVAAMDAIVLSGGADVDPARYGERPDPRTSTRPDRDEWEFAVLRAALELGRPVLAVCRGMQLLNVACGGTLHQHLPDVLRGSAAHQPAPGTFGTTAVRVARASRLAPVLGASLTVHCHHHQAVRALGAGLRAAAWAADETIEAVEHVGHAFVVGVQWHPEEDAADARLFRALTRAATVTA